MLACVLGLCSAAMVEESASLDNHFNGIYKHDHSLRGFYDSTATPDTRAVMFRLFGDLAESQFLVRNNINVRLSDMGKVPELKKHYDVLNQSFLGYFIKNQLQTLENFNQLVLDTIQNDSNYQDLYVRVLRFVEEKFNRIVRPLTSIDQFEEVLSASKIIAVYFGDNDSDFAEYKDFAISHVDFDFFYVFDGELANEIFSLKADMRKPAGTVVAIVRSAELVNDFDPSPMVFTSDLRDQARRESFLEYERYPKLMAEEDATSLAHRVVVRGAKTVLYVHGDNDYDGIEEFEEAVKNLPKKFIYSHVSINSNMVGSYLQLFMMGKGGMSAGNVFIMWMNPIRTVESRAMNKDIASINIVNFVMDFYNENRELFKDEPFTVQPKKSEASIQKDLGYSEEL